MKITFIGLSLTSSWGNGHATTYRALLKALYRRGHDLSFLEHDKPWYRENRDFATADYCKLRLYSSLDDLHNGYAGVVRDADLVIVGSYVPHGVEVIEWVLQNAKGVKAFYDIDTPVTLDKLRKSDFEYIEPEQIGRLDLYLSFAGGYALKLLRTTYEARNPQPFYCSVDPELYYPEDVEKHFLMGYLGTYSTDRQPALERLMLEAARKLQDYRFVVAGPGYPETISWPPNVQRIHHLPPSRHRAFYNSQQIALNVTREPMVEMGHSPSVRLFEAAACGVPVMSDWWTGLDELFTEGEEIFIARDASESLHVLNEIDDVRLRQVGANARQKVLRHHSSDHRARELEQYYREVLTTTAQA